MSHVSRLCCIALLGVSLAAWAEAEKASTRGAAPEAEKQAPAPSAEQPKERAASTQVVYVPPSRGAARVRTGGGTRGAHDAPILAALAPDHVGVTWRAQPTFAWFASEPTQGRVDFTLVDPEAVEPVLEVTLPSPAHAGIHLVRLADHGVELAEGRRYDWSVALVVDPENRDLDVVAAGAIRRDPASPRLSAGLADGVPAYLALARAGVWYDALAELSAAIEARPADTGLRAQRAELLEQVGVGAAASFERQTSTHGASTGVE